MLKPRDLSDLVSGTVRYCTFPSEARATGRWGSERSEGPTQGLRVINRLNHSGLCA